MRKLSRIALFVRSAVPVRIPDGVTTPASTSAAGVPVATQVA
jgi:hypothetical protein